MAIAAAQPSRTRRAPLAWAVAGCLLVVAGLAIGVVTSFGPQLRLDRAAAVAMYAGDGRTAALNDLLLVLTEPGYLVARLALLLPVIIWLVLRRAVWTAVWALATVALISPVTILVKELVDRARPDFAGGGARLSSLSFPSGHAAGSATLVIVVLVLAWPRLTATGRRVAVPLGVAVAVVVGLSRMWLGVHYLSDVVAGWALGTAWALSLALAFGAFPGGRTALPAPDARRGGGP